MSSNSGIRSAAPPSRRLPMTAPRITDKAVRAWVGGPSYRRGNDYSRAGNIFDARRQGNTLKASCEGSSGGPYRVQATLGPRGIEDADCNCPVGGGGRCKHVAALLLAWLHKRKDFREVE